jgi:hypothetical protein
MSHKPKATLSGGNDWMTIYTEPSDHTTKVYCDCGSTEYDVVDNRTKEVMILQCTDCGDKQEWRLNGY